MNTTTKATQSPAMRAAKLRINRIERKLFAAREVEAAASMKTEIARSQGQFAKVRRLERSWFRKSLKTQKFRDLYSEACASII